MAPLGTQVRRRVMGRGTGNIFSKGTRITSEGFSQAAAPMKWIAIKRAAAMGDFFNARPLEKSFSAKRHDHQSHLGMGAAIGRELKPGDEILLTILDHGPRPRPYRPGRYWKEKGRS